MFLQLNIGFLFLNLARKEETQTRFPILQSLHCLWQEKKKPKPVLQVLKLDYENVAGTGWREQALITSCTISQNSPLAFRVVKKKQDTIYQDDWDKETNYNKDDQQERTEEDRQITGGREQQQNRDLEFLEN